MNQQSSKRACRTHASPPPSVNPPVPSRARTQTAVEAAARSILEAVDLGDAPPETLVPAITNRIRDGLHDTTPA